jgi:hypothetical protein
LDAASLELTTDVGVGTVEILQLPPSFAVPFNAFLGLAEGATDWTLTAFDANGDEIAQDRGTQAIATPPCAPFEDDPTPPTLPSPTTANAQSWLRNALAAAKTIYADCNSYERVWPASLAAIEPSLNYDVSNIATAGMISIRDVAADHVLLVTANGEGNIWCLADDAGTGITSYGHVDAATVEACVGGWVGRAS